MYWKEFLKGIIVLTISFLFALLIRETVYSFAKVEGPSMVPTLMNGQIVGVNRLKAPQRGDIIVFQANGEAVDNEDKVYYIKRVIAKGGDVVESKKDGVYVNGERINEPYTISEETGEWTLSSLSEGSAWRDGHLEKVPEGSLFVMGDNRIESEDSRTFGVIDEKKVMGTVNIFRKNY